MPDQTHDTPLGRWLDSLIPAVFPSYAALARAAGVPEPHVSRWRRGSTPGIPNLIKLATATGTSVETLLRIAAYKMPGAAEDVADADDRGHDGGTQ